MAQADSNGKRKFPWIVFLLALLPALKIVLQFFGLEVPEVVWLKIAEFAASFGVGIGALALAKQN